MKIYLVARHDDSELLSSWALIERTLKDMDITATVQSIFDIKCDVLVAPGNSFGIMSGGLDLAYKNYFGDDIEVKVQNAISDKSDFNELLVGDAVYINMGKSRYSNRNTDIIYAPTMRVPMTISHTINSYLSARAALNLAKRMNIHSIAIPGLGTGTGSMRPSVCAKQVMAAIDDVFNDETPLEANIYNLKNDMSYIVGSEFFKVQTILGEDYNGRR